MSEACTVALVGALAGLVGTAVAAGRADTARHCWRPVGVGAGPPALEGVAEDDALLPLPLPWQADKTAHASSAPAILAFNGIINDLLS
ncbi:MAG: hypothetical protein M0Z68_04480 [Gammaproteobacteria bacterium]|nr:hypothetical protein [Gammaproteobacteria bacterium]